MSDSNLANRDPLTNEPGAHPVGTGLGAAIGGAATGVAVGAMAGPIGAAVGGVVGAVAGGLYARGEPILRMTGVDGQHASAGFALP